MRSVFIVEYMFILVARGYVSENTKIIAFTMIVISRLNTEKKIFMILTLNFIVKSHVRLADEWCEVETGENI